MGAGEVGIRIPLSLGHVREENDKKGELSNSLIRYTNLKDLKKHKFEIKKNAKQYTKYRHFLKLKNILKKNIN